jgi:hypothetical protein
MGEAIYGILWRLGRNGGLGRTQSTQSHFFPPPTEKKMQRQMKLYIVMLESEILFVGSCAVDAAEFTKKIANSCVITCHLNATTAAGLAALEVQTF